MSDRPMTLVRQQHDHGCGIAVLAMLTGQTYESTWDDLVAHYPGENDRVTEHGLHQGIVEWYLARLGYVWRTLYLGWKVEPWPPAPFAPRHVAQVKQPSGYTHFVAVTADGIVLDPLDDEPKTLNAWTAVNNITGVWPTAPTRPDRDGTR